MVMTIYNQIYGSSVVLTLMERYNDITEGAMELPVFSSIILTIKGLAVGICVLTYLIDLSDKVTEKNFTIEQFFNATLRMVISYLFIMNADVIVGYLMDIGTSAAQNVSESDIGYDFFGTGHSDNKNYLINGIQKMKVSTILGFIVSSLIPWIISMISQLVLQVVMISRILEIVVLTALSPLSISDIYREGTSSSGVRYMKKVFALGLQVAVIIMINVATQAVISEIVGVGAGESLVNLLETTSKGGTTIFEKDSISAFISALTGRNNTFKVLGIMLARLGLIWNSLPLCEEITGAR